MNYKVHFNVSDERIMTDVELRQWAVEYWRKRRDEANEVLTKIHDMPIDDVEDLMEDTGVALIDEL